MAVITGRASMPVAGTGKVVRVPVAGRKGAGMLMLESEARAKGLIAPPTPPPDPSPAQGAITPPPNPSPAQGGEEKERKVRRNKAKKPAEDK